MAPPGGCWGGGGAKGGFEVGQGSVLNLIYQPRVNEWLTRGMGGETLGRCRAIAPGRRTRGCLTMQEIPGRTVDDQVVPAGQAVGQGSLIAAGAAA